MTDKIVKRRIISLGHHLQPAPILHDLQIASSGSSEISPTVEHVGSCLPILESAQRISKYSNRQLLSVFYQLFH
jgi:hypothetical protein